MEELKELTFLRNKWALVALVILCGGLVATFFAAYYYYMYTDLFQKLKAVPVHISVSIDYGNGTITTFEDVYLFRNATALDGLRAVANVTLGYYEWGVLVEGVNGKSNEPWPGKGWQYWLNEEYGLMGAAKQILINGDKVDWKYATYEGFS